MFVIVPDELIRSCLDLASDTAAAPSGRLHGRWLDGRDCLRLSAAPAADTAVVGIWVAQQEWQQAEPAVRRRLRRRPLLLVCDVATASITCFTREAKAWREVDYDVMRLESDFHKRQDGLFDVSYLRDKLVVVVGLGTGGALIASQLARCGVGRFRLVDFDRLEVHNIARHVCSLDDLGRRKTAAVADLLGRVNPAIAVETFDINVLDDASKLEEIVTGADLVVGATDSEASKSQINRVCWRAGVPAVYGAAYDRGFGGDAFRANPPGDACYACFQEQVADLFNSAPRFGEIDYASIKDPTRFDAQPGLGIDVGFVGLLASKMALLTLLRGTRSRLADLPSNYVMWANQPEWIFDAPLQAIFVNISRAPNCPVCDSLGYVQQALGERLTRGQIAQRAAALLDSAESAVHS